MSNVSRSPRLMLREARKGIPTDGGPGRVGVAPATEPPRETRRSMAVIVYGAFAAGGALVGLVAGWVLRGMW